jgi:hypothetical protein
VRKQSSQKAAPPAPYPHSGGQSFNILQIKAQKERDRKSGIIIDKGCQIGESKCPVIAKNVHINNWMLHFFFPVNKQQIP